MKTVSCLLLFIFSLIPPLFAGEAVPVPADVQWRTVVRVVDGDTVELDGKEKVRLIGIDTPEKFESSKLEKDVERSGQDKATIQALGEKASEFTKTLCEGKKVRLEYDQTRTDKYGRTLAYLHLEDGKVINEEVLKAGYANSYTRFPFKYADKYRELEGDARTNKQGLWADDALSPPVRQTPPAAPTPPSSVNPPLPQPAKVTEDAQGVTVYVTKMGKKYHASGCSYLKSSIPIKLEDAKKAGYTPCSKCNPPQ